MDMKTETKSTMQLAIEAADDFGLEVEVKNGCEALWLHIENDSIRESFAPEIIIAAVKTNAIARGFFEDLTWQENIMGGINVREAALEAEERIALKEFAHNLVDAEDEIFLELAKNMMKSKQVA